VRRIEPAGFTKISALGVEEQRVNVILDFVDPATAWAALGDAFRVEVRVVLWESPSVLLAPTSALFRVGDSWAVFIVEADRARRRSSPWGTRLASRGKWYQVCRKARGSFSIRSTH
jgi:HlyD family secretion protein